MRWKISGEYTCGGRRDFGGMGAGRPLLLDLSQSSWVQAPAWPVTRCGVTLGKLDNLSVLPLTHL